MPNEEELRRIRDFLEQVDADLNLIISDLPSLIDEEFRDLARNAWAAERGRIGFVRERLLYPPDPDIQALNDSGLSGPSLQWKLSGFQRAREAFRNALGRIVGQPLQQLLRGLLGWMNVPLGSLAKVFRELEAVKELKEALEHSLAAA